MQVNPVLGLFAGLILAGGSWYFGRVMKKVVQGLTDIRTQAELEAAEKGTGDLAQDLEAQTDALSKLDPEGSHGR
jgi:hypothetical protein